MGKTICAYCDRERQNDQDLSTNVAGLKDTHGSCARCVLLSLIADAKEIGLSDEDLLGEAFLVLDDTTEWDNEGNPKFSNDVKARFEEIMAEARKRREGSEGSRK